MIDPQEDRLKDLCRDILFRDETEDDDWSLEECQVFCAEVDKSSWFIKRYGRIRPLAKDGRGCPDAQTGYIGNHLVIHLPIETRKKWVIVHEVVHHVMPLWAEDHGPVYCGLLLYFTRKLYGTEKANRMRRLMKKAELVWEHGLAQNGRLE